MIKLIKKYLVILVLFIPIGSINMANADSIKPVSPHAKAYGKTYAQWSVAWLDWAMSIPYETNPITDTTGQYATNGQSGKVWFLAGTFGKTAVRNITIPTDKSLFFPIVNSWWINMVEEGDAPWSPQQEVFASNYVKATIDTANELELTIDGKTIHHIYDYRALGIGLINIPEDPLKNLWSYSFKNNPYYIAIDGYWAMLPPLSVGKHTIRFKAKLFSHPTFALDTTYNITVQRKKSKDHIAFHN